MAFDGINVWAALKGSEVILKRACNARPLHAATPPSKENGRHDG
jgi:hypothetical protein